ncbi:redoxin domain-containing protein [bacterium]|nr:redoxin domain-containing protein [bacterium]
MCGGNCCQDEYKAGVGGDASLLAPGEFYAYHQDELKKVRLADYKGKWLVLFFYPADFSFICPTELEELAGHYDNFKNIGAEILAVSTDSKWVHKAWHDQSKAVKKIQFPMLADPNHELCKTFGTLIEEGDDAGLSLRATFIIDPDGIIKALEINDNGIGRSAKELYRKLQAAKFVHEHDGVQVCPASWEPGDDTLEPGLKLVGKI